MTESMTFEEDQARAGDTPLVRSDDDAFLVRLDGYDGPIDVLLDLARDQKVDLTQISILELARQFLAFIDRARVLELDLAAEYLVMAAWLAYLKSRLLIPRAKESNDEPSAQAMAEALAYQLRRLESMRTAAAALQGLAQKGRDFYARGEIEPSGDQKKTVFTADLYDMLKAYGDIRARAERGKKYELPAFNLMSMDDALVRMTRMLGKLPRTGPHTAWTTLISFLPSESGQEGLYRRSSLASLLTATLEMAKQGSVEIRQDGLFRPVYLRGVQSE